MLILRSEYLNPKFISLTDVQLVKYRNNNFFKCFQNLKTLGHHVFCIYLVLFFVLSASEPESYGTRCRLRVIFIHSVHLFCKFLKLFYLFLVDGSRGKAPVLGNGAGNVFVFFSLCSESLQWKCLVLLRVSVSLVIH